MVSQSWVENKFLYWAETIWGGIVKRISFRFELVKDHKYLMSVLYSGRPKVVGDSLYSVPQSMRIKISERLLGFEDGEAEKIVIHEAVHVGLPLHDKAFRDKVNEFGGAVSEQAVGNGSLVSLQEKRGSRFVTIERFASEDEARAFVKKLTEQNEGKTYRISF